MNIRIGADEMILWLRKNGRRSAVGNDDLGRWIRTTVETLGGQLAEENAAVFWAAGDADKNIGEFALPRTAAQYLIPIALISDLYSRLNAPEAAE